MERQEVAPRPDWLAARADELALLSPYHFLRSLPLAVQQQRFGAGALKSFGAVADEAILEAPHAAQWLLKHLAWDSDYFGVPTFQLITGLFADGVSASGLRVAAAQLNAHLRQYEQFYAFGVVPSEDVQLLQVLTGAGWELIETRLTYYHDAVAEFATPRFAVRRAQPDEAAHVGQIAASARNSYDRFHADPWFGAEAGDAFLARYAREAVAGLCDVVLVPDEPGMIMDSFLAISDLSEDSQALAIGLSKVVLTAVGAENRGWHARLVSETVHRARERGTQYVLMTTQSTNKAVFRTSEKLGFKLGCCTHVLAFRQGKPNGPKQ